MPQALSFANLLVGVDEGDQADHAVAAAAHIAGVTGARLTLVQACPVHHRFWLGEGQAKREELELLQVAGRAARLAEQLAALESKLNLEVGTLVGHARAVAGSPARVLAEVAEETQADVLFLGRHEKDGVLDFGHTLRSALHHAPCALWVQPVPFQPLRRILAPTDLSDSSLRSLEIARDLASTAGAELVVLYSHPSDDLFAAEAEHAPGWPTYVPDDLRKKAREHFDSVLAEFDWRGVPHDDVFTEGDAALSILEARKGIDLVVMATHGHSGVSGLFLGDVTYSVLREGGVGLLALRAED